jgi:hypothetical protein
MSDKRIVGVTDLTWDNVETLKNKDKTYYRRRISIKLKDDSVMTISLYSDVKTSLYSKTRIPQIRYNKGETK